MQAAIGLTSLRICTDSSEYSLLAIAKRTEISNAGLFSLLCCKFGNFRDGFIFAKFSKNIKSSRIGEIPLSFTDIGKSRPFHEF